MWTRLIRIFKHRWMLNSTAHKAIPPEMLQRLQQKVVSSEQRHTGEIRIYIETGLPLSYLWNNAPIRQITRQRALSIFSKLNVWDTANNNGVLIYLLLAERAIELVADRGLNQKVDPALWKTLLLQMREEFLQVKFEEGLNHSVEQVSALLEMHFPVQTSGSRLNELPDEPVLN